MTTEEPPAILWVLECAIGVKIRSTEEALLALNEEFGLLLPKANLAQINTNVVQLAQLMTRRRTLIEVWELLTRRVWSSEPVPSAHDD